MVATQTSELKIKDTPNDTPKDVAKDVAKDIKKAKATVWPVTGSLIHPINGVVYGEQGVSIDSVDPWTQMQVDAGKLRLE